MRHGRRPRPGQWPRPGPAETGAGLDHAVAERVGRAGDRPRGARGVAGHPPGLGRGRDKHHAGNAGRAPFPPPGCPPPPAPHPPRPIAPPQVARALHPLLPRAKAMTAPLQRRGPRPLLLHLSLAMLRSSTSRAASLNWKHAWPNSNEAIAAVLRDALAAGAAGAFPAAVWEETLRQDTALIEGIAAYRRHPW